VVIAKNLELLQLCCSSVHALSQCESIAEKSTLARSRARALSLSLHIYDVYVCVCLCRACPYISLSLSLSVFFFLSLSLSYTERKRVHMRERERVRLLQTAGYAYDEPLLQLCCSSVAALLQLLRMRELGSHKRPAIHMTFEAQ
jgi:hypothetical protein